MSAILMQSHMPEAVKTVFGSPAPGCQYSPGEKNMIPELHDIVLYVLYTGDTHPAVHTQLKNKTT